MIKYVEINVHIAINVVAKPTVCENEITMQNEILFGSTNSRI